MKQYEPLEVEVIIMNDTDVVAASGDYDDLPDQ